MCPAPDGFQERFHGCYIIYGKRFVTGTSISEGYGRFTVYIQLESGNLSIPKTHGFPFFQK